MLLGFRFVLLALLASLGLLALLPGCGSKRPPDTAATGSALSPAADPAPRLDSPFVVRALQAEARFRAQERWARKFYRERQFRLAWFRQHRLVPPAATLLATVARAADDGLDPRRYPVRAVQDSLRVFEKLAAAGGSPNTTRRNALERGLDVGLSGLYFTWASDFYRGVANPADTRNTAWRVKRNKIKLDHALAATLGERVSSYAYADFSPLHPQYGYLKKALAELRAHQAAGGWPRLPSATLLRPGAVDGLVVALLRQRLRAAAVAHPADSSRDSALKVSLVNVANASPIAAANPVATATYDAELVAAVRGFQADYGLRPTGVVGGETLRALNVPLDERIRQVILNLERWRWLPKKFEPDYLLVNIPEFRLRVFTQGREALTMRVIVGKALTATPVFSDKLEYVVLAPYWNVPFSIIEKELRPQLIANPRACLARYDMEVVRGSGRRATVVDPGNIDWARLTAATFRYTLRRRPGPRNDLGDVKFIFPNSDDIYLHDTPHGQLFAESRRDFSHGCVRLEEPVRLATYLLRDAPGWGRRAVQDTIARRRERYITLRQPLPVYLVYFTAWADTAGHAHFRDDIYGHDRTLAKVYFKG